MVEKNHPTILLIDATPDFETDGIFQNLVDPPWSSLNIAPGLLDMEYYLAHSGKKPISPIVHYFCDENGEITSSGMDSLAALVRLKFYEPWSHLLDTYYAEYDPLKNYQISEQEEYEEDAEKNSTDETTYGKTRGMTDSLTHGKVVNTSDEVEYGKKVERSDERNRENSDTSAQTVTYGKTETTEGDATRTSETGRYGFNSNESVPTDTGDSTEQTEETVHTTGSDGGITRNTATDHDTTESSEEASGSDARTIVESDSGTDSRAVSENLGGKDTLSSDALGHTEGTKNRTRSGLNGLNSYQRLIAEDRKLWLDNFFDQVYRDVDSVLTLPIYPSRRRLQPWVLIPNYPNI